MIGLAQIKILSARARQARRQFGPDECAEQGQAAAEKPDSQNQEWSVYAEGDHVRIDEDARADDAAHHDHGGIEHSKQLPWLDRIQRRLAQAKFSLSLQKERLGSRLDRDHLNTEPNLSSGEMLEIQNPVVSFQLSVPS